MENPSGKTDTITTANLCQPSFLLLLSANEEIALFVKPLLVHDKTIWKTTTLELFIHPTRDDYCCWVALIYKRRTVLIFFISQGSFTNYDL